MRIRWHSLHYVCYNPEKVEKNEDGSLKLYLEDGTTHEKTEAPFWADRDHLKIHRNLEFNSNRLIVNEMVVSLQLMNFKIQHQEVSSYGM